jgi:hypothetical protein
MDIHVRRINSQTTDVDVHRTKLPTMGTLIPRCDKALAVAGLPPRPIKGGKQAVVDSAGTGIGINVGGATRSE